MTGRLHAPKVGGLGSISDQGTRFHMMQLGIHIRQLKILPNTTKIWCSQTNILKEHENTIKKGS